MKPITFPQSNRNLTRSDCLDLPVWTNGEECISCWSLSWRERLAVLFGGVVWLRVLFGPTQPPVLIQAGSPFATSGE